MKQAQVKQDTSCKWKRSLFLVLIFASLFFSYFELAFIKPEEEISSDDCFQQIPYVYFHQTGNEIPGKNNPCDKSFRTVLTQAIVSNGATNVVLLEIGSGCKSWSEPRKIKRFELPLSSLENFKDWLQETRSLERMSQFNEPMTNWTESVYYNSFYQIYAIYEWIKTQPKCVDRVTLCDADTMMYNSAESIAKRFPGYEFLVHIPYPYSTRIHTHFSRAALEDFILYMNSSFDYPITDSFNETTLHEWEFLNDLNALGAYAVYNVTLHPCFGLGINNNNSFGTCQIEFKSRPPHVPKYKVATVAWPICRNTEDCAYISESLNSERDLGTVTLLKTENQTSVFNQIRWIRCLPYVEWLDPIRGFKEWIRIWGFHGQDNQTKLFLENYVRPDPSSIECKDEDCICDTPDCIKCAKKFEKFAKTIDVGYHD